MSNLATTRIDVDISRLTRESALELAKTSPEKASAVIMALIAQNTDALPNTSFVKRSEGVYLKKVRSTLTLRESDGTLVKVGSKKVGNDYEPVYDLAISGYRKLNEVMALQIIRPETVIVDGTAQMNPYIAVNPETRMPEVVYARCLAVGYSPMGSLCAVDTMVRLDVNIYLLENIQSKIARAERNADQIGIYGAKNDPPKDDKGQVLAGYVFFPIHSVGGLGVWVNYRNPTIQDILKDHTTRLKFIERLAQSFAERNAIKAHPATPKGIQTRNGVAYVRCTGWTTDFKRDDLRELQELVAADRLQDFRDGDGNTIDVQAREVTGMDDSDREAMNQVAEEEQAQERREKKEAGLADEGETEAGEAGAPDPGSVDILAQASDAFQRLVELKGMAGAKRVLKELEIKNLEETKPEDLTRFLKKVEEIEGA